MDDKADKKILTAMSASALQALVAADMTGNLGKLGVDDTCRLARTASVDPSGAFPMFGKAFKRTEVKSEAAYEHILDTAFSERYDNALLGAIEQSDVDVRDRQATRVRAISSASLVPPPEFQATLDAVEAGDASPYLKAVERMYYN